MSTKVKQDPAPASAAQWVLTFYAAPAGEEGGAGARSGGVTAVQRTSSDLRLNPHLHMIALDGTWREDGGGARLGGARTSQDQRSGRGVGRLVRRMERHLRRNGQLRTFEDEGEPSGEDDPEGNLAASADGGAPRHGLAARDDAG